MLGVGEEAAARQLAAVSLLLPLYGFQGQNSGHRLGRKPPFLLSRLSGPPGHLLRSEVMLTVVEKSDGPQVLFFFFFKLKHWLQIERQTIRKIRVGNMGNDTIVTQSARRNESEHKAKQSPLNLKGQTGKGHRRCDGEETNLTNTCAGKCSPS